MSLEDLYPPLGLRITAGPLELRPLRDDDLAATFHRDLIHLALGSPANLAILPLQDVLGFGNDCRLNTPSTPTGNWQWRCAGRFLTDETAAWLRDHGKLHR